MKLSYGKRVLMFFHWLFSLLLCVMLMLCAVAPEYMRSCGLGIRRSLGNAGTWVIGILLLLVYLGLAVFQLLIILNKKRRDESGFITVDSSDTGRVRVSISAIEQMARQSVRGIGGITEMNIGIEDEGEAIAITVDAVVVSGTHIPTVTSNMQRAIRQFVEDHCGMPVRSVAVSVDAVSGQPEGMHRRFLNRTKGEGGKAPSWVKPPKEAAKAVAEPETVTPEVSGEPEVSAESEYAPEEPEPEVSAPEAAAEPAEDAAEPEIWEDSGERFDAAEGKSAEAEEPVKPDDGPKDYDFDKPYESEFVKDLEAMRAREAAKKAEYEDH